jgi:hypothetical protein
MEKANKAIGNCGELLLRSQARYAITIAGGWHVQILGLCSAVLVLLLPVQNLQPNFSVEWKFVAIKSKLQIPVPDSGIFTIDHREPVFRMSRTLIAEGKTDTWSIDLTTDGKEVVVKSTGETTRGHVSWDGSDLVYQAKIILNDGREGTDTVRYHLSDGGRTITAIESSRGPVVKFDNLWVFEKQR